MNCRHGEKHRWQPDGGCSENPGVFDNGNGVLIFREKCRLCGTVRRRGKDYTGNRPENTFKWQYETQDVPA